MIPRRLVLLGLTAGIVPGLARADGDDFFQSELFNPDGTPVRQNGFVGTVKDDSGRYIEDATITVRVTVDLGQTKQPLAYNAYTNALGRYRTLDVNGVVADFFAVDVDIDPKDIDVTAEKQGYILQQRFNRGPTGKVGPIEINFVLKKRKG